MKLTDLKINEKRKIIKVNGEGNLRHRLLEMGIIPNTIIEITNKAPLGDPIQIKVRTYEISIRKEDANLIEVEDVSC